jgi:hypothetical protein
MIESFDQEAAIEIRDRGDSTVIPAVFEPGRILCCEIHMKRFQSAFLRIIYR